MTSTLVKKKKYFSYAYQCIVFPPTFEVLRCHRIHLNACRMKCTMVKLLQGVQKQSIFVSLSLRLPNRYFRCILASLKEGLSIRPYIHPSITRVPKTCKTLDFGHGCMMYKIEWETSLFMHTLTCTRMHPRG